MTGRVTVWFIERGYGFLIDDSTREKVFVHGSDTHALGILKPGSRVRYETQADPGRRPRAINIELISEPYDEAG